MRLKLIMWEKENGFKARFVAQKIGVTDSTWSKIKLGKQSPTVQQLEKFRDVFQIDDVFELFKEERS